MNESIGNATAGWPFRDIARNLQVEGDLVRERGGCYLGIMGVSGTTLRDSLVESALWAAAGARPYNACHPAVQRYLTRYAQYTLDENLRRLARPEAVLKQQAETRLWWDGFVYETPLENTRRQLVVNLLNLPLDDCRINPEATNPPDRVRTVPGTDPVGFAVALPEGVRATAAHLIDPLSLEVEPLPLRDGRFEVPVIALWRVAVIDLEVTDHAPSLARSGRPRSTPCPHPSGGSGCWRFGQRIRPKPLSRGCSGLAVGTIWSTGFPPPVSPSLTCCSTPPFRTVRSALRTATPWSTT